MNIPAPAQALFASIYSAIDPFTDHVCNEIFIRTNHLAWTVADRKQLRTLVRGTLASICGSTLGTFDNVGCSLEATDGTIGYRIHNIIATDDDTIEGPDIRKGEMDYIDMWWEYLLDKEGNQTPR